ncbi:MAG: energy transducer TonB [Gammaproteobacteria bacterium]|nr:MAG: energy transducer TonB [Gammaproteobacteria bacterium]
MRPAPDEIGPLPPPGPATVALSALEFRRFVQPDYPRNLAERGVEGWVELKFLVNASGEVEDLRLIGSEPAGVFDEAALKAVRRWRFKPHRVDGEAVAAYSQVRLRFKE